MVLHKLIHEDKIESWANDRIALTTNSEEYLKDLYNSYRDSVTFPENCAVTRKKDFHYLLKEVLNRRLDNCDFDLKEISSEKSKQGIILHNISIKVRNIDN